MSAPKFRYCYQCGAFVPVAERTFDGECCRHAPRPRLGLESDDPYQHWPDWPVVMSDFGCADSVPCDEEES